MRVFAQIPVDEFAKSARDYQRGAGADFLIFAGVLLIALLAAALVWRVIHYKNASRRPLLLFYDLADFHRIPGNVQKRLTHFARAHDVADPAYLFVCCELVKRIQSLEMEGAGNEKERRRTQEFFSDFLAAAFGTGAEGDQAEGGGAP